MKTTLFWTSGRMEMLQFDCPTTVQQNEGDRKHRGAAGVFVYGRRREPDFYWQADGRRCSWTWTWSFMETPINLQISFYQCKIFHPERNTSCQTWRITPRISFIGAKPSATHRNRSGSGTPHLKRVCGLSISSYQLHEVVRMIQL